VRRLLLLEKKDRETLYYYLLDLIEIEYGLKTVLKIESEKCNNFDELYSVKNSEILSLIGIVNLLTDITEGILYSNYY